MIEYSPVQFAEFGDLDVPDVAFDEGFFALELELLELPCIREVALVHTELPDLGETLLVAFVPLSPEQEGSGRRAANAACARRLPGVFAHAVATSDIPRSADGEVRASVLVDRLLPQIARDLTSPVEMSD
ncbi:hypothetical protein [Kitasatospora sp. MAP5-34]|uniref:hypothetical protein n=1 Tax=Kitasatospora sp. MAP5-34 TaxID=3035102 RepID=UPI002473F95A|nr:hypothetical protein [Kitasatospora sp. MAP5-34]MDH6577485.1 acyl-coenzyme A synthetase/AMP-(fatty) acid ligase [Kitasatospora sp. MAP5-34]